MIYDRIENWKKYFSANGLFKVESFLRKDLAKLQDGKHEIDGELIFAYVSTYETKPLVEAVIESHERYIDVQVLIDGEERLDCFSGCPIEVKKTYDESDDVAFYHRPDEVPAAVILKPGRFVLFFPEDIHSPQIAVKAPQQVRKIVVKIDRDLIE